MCNQNFFFYLNFQKISYWNVLVSQWYLGKKIDMQQIPFIYRANIKVSHRSILVLYIDLWAERKICNKNPFFPFRLSWNIIPKYLGIPRQYHTALSMTPYSLGKNIDMQQKPFRFRLSSHLV
ncbi:hypothetical protein OCU04_009488 [Sclerotinia nivalis]|uniref:Uncharacterized protein n=1 Tax=Sclerotinia nivalis TaxID=352851 RepID=A0A9X0AF95_9HELO|nr:hypothetical protein OCU04_009488 [Sclerotinia nivalis]